MYQESDVKVAELIILRLDFRLVESEEDNGFRALIYTHQGIFAGRTRQPSLRLRCPELGKTVSVNVGDTVHLEYIKVGDYQNIIWSRSYLLLAPHLTGE